MHVVVIGAGAAGMMAAYAAATQDATVVLLEKNSKTGVKILMSGGTRCNLTHHTDARGIAEEFGHAKSRAPRLQANAFCLPAVGNTVTMESSTTKPDNSCIH